ncbi:hypothetical protein [Roseofilum capinflatum]|uniref:Uncharacterized protein n=1 Tax=Roseofilum capinflatum BLCC-M114 TaxID=3022440 RepID=A0ABT7BDB6_9CYAN|nr:hypothetical protein [Roseofilum capinflatum]MDJ1177179.1 hypothetical protein [Roseofilum capinflatum BLCC-M114]
MSILHQGQRAIATQSGFTPFSSSLQSGSWITLEELPSHWAAHEALLLCEVSPGKWMSWVPNYGEYLIHLA